MPISIDNVLFPGEYTDDKQKAAARKRVNKANKARAERLKDLQKAGKSKQKQAAQKSYTGSYLVKFAAMVQAARHIPYKNRKTLDEYLEISKKWRLGKPIDEPVRLHWREKSNGEKRYYCSFGALRRASQRLVADMLGCQFKHKPWQYEGPNRGIAKAVKQIRALHAQGYCYAAKLDIKKFYDSFLQEGVVAAMPIGNKKIVENVVTGRHYVWGPHSSQGDIDPLLYQGACSSIQAHGIPQGSVCSPIIGSFFISKLTFDVPAGAAVLDYVDDFAIFAESAEKLEKTKNALIAATAQMSVGNFEFIDKTSGAFQSPLGFDCLGHTFFEAHDGSLSVYMAANKSDQFGMLLNKASVEIPAYFDNAVDPILKYEITRDKTLSFARQVRSFLLAFNEVDGIETDHQLLNETIEIICSVTDQDAEEIIELSKQNLSEYGDHEYGQISWSDK